MIEPSRRRNRAGAALCATALPAVAAVGVGIATRHRRVMEDAGAR